MKSLIITAIFVVLGLQSAHAAETLATCKYLGKDGETAEFKIDENLLGSGVSNIFLKDGSKMEVPVSASVTIGDKDGYMALVVTWGSLFDTMTSALPGKGNVISGPAFSITSFSAKGPKAVRGGNVTCAYEEGLLHTLKSAK